VIAFAKAADAGADASKLEREIDALVTALYGLTPGEIAFIEATSTRLERGL